MPETMVWLCFGMAAGTAILFSLFCVVNLFREL